MTIIEKVYGEVAKQEGVTRDQVEKAVYSMLKYVTNRFESKEYDKPIRLQYLGLFYCKPKRLEHLKEKGRL